MFLYYLAVTLFDGVFSMAKYLIIKPSKLGKVPKIFRISKRKSKKLGKKQTRRLLKGMNKIFK